jgi:hypothetical protein
MLLAILQSSPSVWEWIVLLIPFNIIGHAIGYALHGILAKFQFSLHLLNRNIKYGFGFLIVSSLLFSLLIKDVWLSLHQLSIALPGLNPL